MTRQELAQRRVHQRRDLARLLEAQADGCAEMHVNLVRLDAGEKIPSQPGHDYYQRGDCHREEREDESAAPRNCLGEPFTIVFAKPTETLLERRLVPTKETFGV